MGPSKKTENPEGVAGVTLPVVTSQGSTVSVPPTEQVPGHGQVTGLGVTGEGGSTPREAKAHQSQGLLLTRGTP